MNNTKYIMDLNQHFTVSSSLISKFDTSFKAYTDQYTMYYMACK